MYEYKAKVVNVVDGDTMDLQISLGFNIYINERLRVLNCDTPEKFGAEKPLGMIMKHMAEDMLLGEEVVIKSHKADEAATTDSFGRGLCELYVNGKNLADYYTSIGANKYAENYSPENVLKFEEQYKDCY